MNPVPTDAQWLILYQVDDGDVFFDGNGTWRAKSPVGHFNVTRILWKLLELGLVQFPAAGGVEVTAAGMETLKRRSVYDVLERRARRAGGG
jgi:hypothetical protein